MCVCFRAVNLEQGFQSDKQTISINWRFFFLNFVCWAYYFSFYKWVHSHLNGTYYCAAILLAHPLSHLIMQYGVPYTSFTIGPAFNRFFALANMCWMVLFVLCAAAASISGWTHILRHSLNQPTPQTMARNEKTGLPPITSHIYSLAYVASQNGLIAIN